MKTNNFRWFSQISCQTFGQQMFVQKTKFSTKLKQNFLFLKLEFSRLKYYSAKILTNCKSHPILFRRTPAAVSHWHCSHYWQREQRRSRQSNFHSTSLNSFHTKITKNTNFLQHFYLIFLLNSQFSLIFFQFFCCKLNSINFSLLFHNLFSNFLPHFFELLAIFK